MKNLILLISLLIPYSAFSQFQVPDREVKRILPQDNYISKDTEYKKQYVRSETDNMKLEEQNRIIRAELEKLKYSNGGSPVQDDIHSSKYKKKKRGFITRGKKYSSGLQTFSYSEDHSFISTVLPAGSWVRGTLLTGLMVSTKSFQKTVIQLDYGFIGPNQSKINLKSCNIIGLGRADLSIERILIKPQKISCVKSNGKHFVREIDGFVAGSDSYNGLEAVYSSKQGKVFLAAVLAGIVQGATQAYDLATVQTSIIGAGGDNPIESKNFTGSMGTYAAVKGLQNGANLTTQWYLNQAKSLLPSLSKGSGSKLWVLVTESVNIPQLDED